MIQIELIGLIVFVVSVIFSAGILFGRVNAHTTTIKDLSSSIDEIQKDISFIREKIARIEAVLNSYMEER